MPTWRTRGGAVVGIVPLRTVGGGPIDVVGVGGPTRAVASFLLVLVVGTAIRYRWGDVLDRSVEATVERPARGTIYGVAAVVFGWLMVAYAFAQAFRLGTALGTAAVALGTAGALVVVAAGFVVVGTTVVTILDRGWAWAGPFVGAAISGLAWLALPFGPGLAVWLLLAAVGVGGPARRWVHASQSVERAVDG
jgi:hypothetical protein